MANHKSAKKRARQNTKRQERNRAQRSALRTVLKTLSDEATATGEELKTKLRQAEKALRKAASSGLIPKQRASRKISRLYKAKSAQSK